LSKAKKVVSQKKAHRAIPYGVNALIALTENGRGETGGRAYGET